MTRVAFDTISLTTKRLMLRPLVIQEAQHVADLCHNINVARMTSRIPHPYTTQNAIEFIQLAYDMAGRHEALIFAIIRNSDGKLIGVIGANQVQQDEFELGYWLGEAYWGQGYATEAAKAALSCVLKVIKPGKLSACYALDNQVSGRVLEKIGFVKTPQICNVYFKARGENTPCQFMDYPLHKGFFRKVLEKHQRSS